jgi:hypothetical protein
MSKDRGGRQAVGVEAAVTWRTSCKRGDTQNWRIATGQYVQDEDTAIKN